MLRPVRVAFATCSALPDGWHDDHLAASLLGAEYRSWDDASVDWEAFDRVVIRSTWDYTSRVADFVSWCHSVGSERLRNRPDLVAFNADKRYLGRLAAPTVPTVYVAPGDALPRLDGEVVVKPGISAGARDTGRFGPAAHGEARSLIEQIQVSGRVALVQPYIASVDHRGETALVFLGGELSHVLRKRPILERDEVAPLAEGELAPARAMLREDLVALDTAEAAEHRLARQVVRQVSEAFGTPVYMRVDVVIGPGAGPLLLEFEAIEPHLYLTASAGAAQRLADAVRAS
jgi:glutathione synthase/RimK-type ligase-like ATP-grasp enzyme